MWGCGEVRQASRCCCGRFVMARPFSACFLLCHVKHFVHLIFSVSSCAAKFTRSGSITVSGGACQDGSWVFLAVTDTGLGIPKDKFQQIFGAFEQVDMSTTRSYGGTGLGLHLVKQLVEAHNGENSFLDAVSSLSWADTQCQ